MKKRSFYRGGELRSAWALAALVVATAFPVTAFAADRVVLGEEFTSTW